MPGSVKSSINCQLHMEPWYIWYEDTWDFIHAFSLPSFCSSLFFVHSQRKKKTRKKKIARFRVGHYIGNIFTNNIAWNCKIYAGKKHWNQFQTICFRDILLKNTTISVIFDHNLESFRIETSSSSVDQMEKQLFLSNLKM